MACLMHLPCEIRALIIQHVVAATRQPVTYDDVRKEAPDMSYSSWTRGEGIRYESDAKHFRSNCHGLLLSNRLFRAETRRELQSMGDPSYELDVVIMRNGDLTPTWTHIPWTTTRIKQLTITFRGAHPSAFNLGLYYYPISRAWSIYSLLERFITLGPTAPGSCLDLEPIYSGSTDSPGPILSVVKSAPPRPTCQIERLVIASTDGVKRSCMPHDDFVDVLRARFKEMTWTSLPTHPYAALLLSHLGSIEFRRGGETLETWYLEDLIRDSDPGAYNRSRFRMKHGDDVKYGTYEEWRVSILEVREKKGLSIPKHLR